MLVLEIRTVILKDIFNILKMSVIIYNCFYKKIDRYVVIIFARQDIQLSTQMALTRIYFWYFFLFLSINEKLILLYAFK